MDLFIQKVAIQYFTSMDNIFRLFPLGILAMCVIGFTSCNDDNDSKETLWTADQRTLNEMLSYQCVLNHLFNSNDSLYTTPCIGVELDAATPGIYSTGVADENEAREAFYSCCLYPELCATESDGSICYDMGTYGSLVYHPNYDDDALATLDINLSSINVISQLRFIPTSLWPTNSLLSDIHLGDIVTDKTYGWYWVCVQESNGGRPALFITFDNYNARTIFINNVSESSILLQTTSASVEALRAWYRLVKSGHETFNDNESALKLFDKNLYEATGYINGRTPMNNLYYVAGVNSEKIDRSGAHWGSAIPNTIVNLGSSVAFTEGESATFTCNSEDLIPSKNRINGASSYFHSGTCQYQISETTLSKIYLFTHTSSVSIYNNDQFYTDNPLANYLYTQTNNYLLDGVLKQLFASSDTKHQYPVLGEALDKSSPTIFTIFTNNGDEAKTVFDKMCLKPERLSTKENGDIEYDLGELGSVVYHAENSDTLYASIDINVEDVPSITQVRYVPPFDVSVGDVLKDYDYGYNWACVQALSKNTPAMFITFDEQLNLGTEDNGSLKKFSSAPKEAFEKWFNLVVNNKDIYSANNAEMKSVAPNLWDAAGIINGRYNMSRLETVFDGIKAYFFYSVGTRYENANPNPYYGRLDLDETNSLSQYTIVTPDKKYMSFQCTSELSRPTYISLFTAAYSQMNNAQHVFGPLFHFGKVYLNGTVQTEYSNCRIYINNYSQSSTETDRAEICRKYKRLMKVK